MLFFYIFDVEFSVGCIFMPWLIVIAYNLFIRSNAKGRIDAYPILPDKVGKRPDALVYFLVIALSFEIFYVFFRALISPMEAYDALSIYAMKAKIFYLARSVPSGYFSELGRLFPHPEYPLNIPLAETLAYLSMGRLNDLLVKAIFPVYFIALLALFYFSIRSFAGKRYSLLFTFLLASLPQFSSYATNGYLDLVLAYYVFGSSAFIFLWFRDKGRIYYLVISAVFAGLSAWTKNEGIIYCAINIALISIFGRETYKKILYAVIILAVMSPWLWVRISSRIPAADISAANLLPSALVRNIGRVWPIINEFQVQFFGPKKWNIIWIVFFFTFAARFKRSFSGEILPVTLSVLLPMLSYAGIYMISVHGVEWHLSTTLSRFFIHFVPLAVYYLAVVLRKDLKV